MERKKALALAAAVTCILGSTTVAAAAVGGTSILGFGGASEVRFASLVHQPDVGQSTQIVRRTKDVYDKFVVDTPTARSTRSTGVKPATVAGPARNIAAPAVQTPSDPESGGRGGAAKEVDRRHPSAKPPATRKQPARPPAQETNEPTTDPPNPPTTTTVAPVTTTTRPPGVPKDWPVGKPIPPMPPNCKQPQLEDNGVWNCQDD